MESMIRKVVNSNQDVIDFLFESKFNFEEIESSLNIEFSYSDGSYEVNDSNKSGGMLTGVYRESTDDGIGFPTSYPAIVISDKIGNLSRGHSMYWLFVDYIYPGDFDVSGVVEMNG